ncbi:hypothetical protein [Lactococcus lactis]|jgi:hypothetical protein|uniref:hypothetical protein n=1 Tax=Lactococcus lactis TaxID=1358 RepID=UPI00071D528F|nr:hypothetical protein [Lactococcus lactis]KST77595.1 hypothetical protein LK231_1779 [Lactococcus lactis subsp. lactis]MBR8680165.1 hypothetical protein [Lactococcus lactis subsp. lactis]MBR8682589.1 hypothetical protein [Lactococcus lactis subsp. lactis]MBR8687728.1 hypothetical protein [Lactococcus lactis subsp. lactis]MBS3730814.1 hypothetical protein [Lactococcus lactis subsp. lactis]
MKLSSQCFQAEKEYKEVYIHFKTACCLDWDKEDEIIKAYKRALIILNHLKSIYPSLYKVYKNYEIKIIGLYNSSVLFLWNERKKINARN